MTTILPIGGFQAQQSFAFNHDTLSTMSMKQFTFTKTPYKLEISEPLPYSQQIYDQIAYEEYAQGVKAQFEAMGFQAPIRRNGNLRYSGLINRLPKSFKYNTTERGTSTNPSAKADKSISRAISAGYIRDVKEESFESPSLSKIKDMTKEQFKRTEKSKERLRDTQMTVATLTPLKKGKKDNTVSSSDSRSPVSPLQGKGKGKGPLTLVDKPSCSSGLESSSSPEEYAVSSAELAKLKNAAKLTKGIEKADKETNVYERIDKNMKKNRRGKNKKDE